MKIDWSFPKRILLALIIVGGLSAYPLAVYGDGEIVKASVIGAALTTVNVLLGFAAIEFSFDKSTTTFFKYVIGGMGIRMMLLAGVLILLIKVFALHIPALIASMGILYVIFLTLEILYIQKKIQSKLQH
jgi:Ca2+/H+ antiporter